MLRAVEAQHQGQLRASAGRRALLPWLSFSIRGVGAALCPPIFKGTDFARGAKNIWVSVVSGAGSAPNLSPGAPPARSIPSSTVSILLLLMGTTRGEHPQGPPASSPPRAAPSASPGAPRQLEMRLGPQPKAGPGLGERGCVQSSSGCELALLPLGAPVFGLKREPSSASRKKSVNG